MKPKMKFHFTMKKDVFILVFIRQIESLNENKLQKLKMYNTANANKTGFFFFFSLNALFVNYVQVLAKIYAAKFSTFISGIYP